MPKIFRDFDAADALQDRICYNKCMIGSLRLGTADFDRNRKHKGGCYQKCFV